METKKELKILFWIVAIFAAVFFMPLQSARFTTAIDAMLDLAQWYAREHVVLCLLPAFFIAGVIAVSDSRVRQSGFCIEILWGQRKEMVVLFGSSRFRRYIGGVLLHHPPVIYQYL